MKKITLQKFSLLGIVLMGASAVTAAILPSKGSDDKSNFDQRGSITVAGTNNALGSCTPTAVITAPCNVTAASGTTGVGEGTLSNATTLND